MRDLKYDFPGGIFNRAGEYFLPDDEVTFVLRGKDSMTLPTVDAYIELCYAEAGRHPEGSQERLHCLQHAKDAERSREFIAKWQEEHSDRIGLGCTLLQPKE